MPPLITETLPNVQLLATSELTIGAICCCDLLNALRHVGYGVICKALAGSERERAARAYGCHQVSVCHQVLVAEDKCILY